VPKASINYYENVHRQQESYWKNDLLLEFQKQWFCLDTKSKCHYHGKGPPSSTVILKNDLLLVFQKGCVFLDTKSKCHYYGKGPPSTNSHIEK
jgi:hypothetical protein